MERVAALADFRRGIFPDNFASNIGYAGAEVQSLLSNMVHADERQRLNCEEVKRDMGRIVHSLKT
jgi:translation initiation factor 2-alpha kinase 3